MILKEIAESRKTTLINLRVTHSELEVFRTKAKMYTGGKVSAVIIKAVNAFDPKPSELTEAS